MYSAAQKARGRGEEACKGEALEADAIGEGATHCHAVTRTPAAPGPKRGRSAYRQ